MATNLSNVLEMFPRQEKNLSYGTAGFRENVSLPLPSVFVKMGVLAALRSQTVGSKCIGVMVTASHNPECDNGVKIVDADGGMMAQSWEPYAEELVNAKDTNAILAAINRISLSHGVSKSTPCAVVVGRDTRPHSQNLVKCIIRGARAFGATVHDMGLTTTPQLHFIVQKANENATKFPILEIDRQSAVTNYYETIGKGYLDLVESALLPGQSLATVSVVVDGSNGIGSISITEFATVLNALKPDTLHVDLRNGAYTGPVNEGCGAEHVQKGQVPPKGLNPDADSGKTLCSFDGDADRIVFHSYLLEKKWILLDGDKIAALLSLFISQELQAAGLQEEFRLGVVQTAYANGASTIFLKKHNIPYTMAKTGVKYLHHKAHEFDIGTYFEANGHGTVLFSNKFMTHLSSLADSSQGNDTSSVADKRRKLAIRRLHILEMNIPAWHEMYTDLPSKQLKVPVTNKSIVSCSEDETFVTSPPALQEELNRLMGETPLGRCFVRPSGTEDVMRVYAEGSTQEDADRLALRAVEAINRFVG